MYFIAALCVAGFAYLLYRGFYRFRYMDCLQEGHRFTTPKITSVRPNTLFPQGRWMSTSHCTHCRMRSYSEIQIPEHTQTGDLAKNTHVNSAES